MPRLLATICVLSLCNIASAQTPAVSEQGAAVQDPVPLTQDPGTGDPVASTPQPAPANEASPKPAANPAATAYKDPFYNNDFSYLNSPDYCDWHLGEGWKQLHHPCQDITWDFSGQYRMRYHREQNHRGLGLTGRDDSFLLHRTRLYGDVKAYGGLRGYVEYLDAVSEHETFAPRPIEENRSDLLNAFGDMLLVDNGCGELWARVGRQELLYGAQRLASPLDWANTRRTFEGAKVFWRGEEWDADAFWTMPVAPDAKNFDQAIDSQEFLGTWLTWKEAPDGPLDLYFLRYAEYDGATDFDFNTFGARWNGSYHCWQWDLQGAYQFGEFGAADVNAGMFTAGIGRSWKNTPWQWELWTYYDWASGDDVQGAGFHHLFPLAHKYLGLMDLFGRRNITDWNFVAKAKPTKKLQFLAWYHIFHLENGNDIPYNVVMGPSPGMPLMPGGSTDLGQELDFTLAYTLNERSSVLFGYSHFWSGDWFDTNPTAGLFNGDGSFYYTQWTLNF